MHPYTSYWWSEDGMAASVPEKDYVHLVADGLRSNEGEVTSYAYNFAVWETLSSDRAETLILLDDYLSEKIDLITIQLGENANDISTYESDFEELIAYVREKAPNASVCVIGDFWSNEDRDEQKEAAAASMQVPYVSLAEIKDNSDYMVGMGATVYGDDGEAHTVEHSGVATHPGDNGMAYIAREVLKVVK
jgi:hypothetical protein